MVGLQNAVIAMLTLYLWHFKIHLSILINRMTSLYGCSYRKQIPTKLIPHLWQITVKFNITLLTVIKLLPSSDSHFPSDFHIEAEMSDAKFNIIPLASSSLLSSTIHLWYDFPSDFLVEVKMTNVKFQITPLALPSLPS